jgi:hypothetical protein
MGDELGAELFCAIYLGMLGVVFAMGPAETKSEARWRSVTLMFCAVLAIVMIMWVVVRVLAAIAHIV